ncbi:ABC transporter ATP-binding protein [Klugiella xanthotipulae]|uniref:ABC-2 type transport system ATP-binding protein n=1 Tax=Klugiella xanthotipulae TaxID=244735 RepID=A0A543I6I2_9MICO|nr:ABC transporter ATP-binding protein [Klugiella xanthotipulae]TQM66188.1 ABC-2 type transport system ATP-binding protein [Klugiella xanthotipulae]
MLNKSPAVQIGELTVVRGRTTALNDITLDVPAGHIVGLIGPSGCGKTTLMRAIVGVQRITSGRITVLGEAAGHRSLRSQIGYVTQAPSVYDDLSVRDNLRYFRRVLGAPASDVDRVIAQTGLGPQADSLAESLSGGQRSRASLAVALMGSPRLLVLDEPTVGLDPVLHNDLWDIFHRLRDAGMSIIVSSHVMDEASRCDGLVLLRDGRMLASGSPAALRERTGAASIEEAFIDLINEQSTGDTR